MATTTQLVGLTLTLDGQPHACQIAVAEHIPPGHVTTTTQTPTACPDGWAVEESIAWQPGRLTGDVFAATEDTGLTWILRRAWNDSTELAYEIVHAEHLGPEGAIREAGTCRVASFSYGRFQRGGTWKHPVDLQLTSTGGPQRPAA